MSDATDRRTAAVHRLRAYLDNLDEQIRRDGEPPLRQQVAEQARDELKRIGPREP